jgi:3-hydroxybutyryl-CoA dehydrogenase
MKNIKTILVAGAGTMGQGIAQVCAQAGYAVYLFDVQPEFIQRGLLNIDKSLSVLVSKNKLTQEESVAIAGRIKGTETVDVPADLVVEAIVEDAEAKRKLFTAIEKVVSPSAILTSNTSSIPITQLAASLRHPERLAGLHFFNPAPVMKLVEIISGAATDLTVVEKLQEFVKTIGKVSVIANDAPGFIVNRVARHFYVEALKLVEEGVASHQQIDELLRASGFKMGTFELMDLIGIDINFSVTSSLYNGFHQEPRFRPSRVQQQKVLAGHLGKKSGKGFYDYSKP